MDYKSIQEIQAILYRASLVCENPCVRVNMHVCACVSVCIREREAETDGPVLPSLKSTGVLPSTSEDGSLDLGRKGLLLAQCLGYLRLETKNTYSYCNRKWAGLLGNFPWREHAAICLVELLLVEAVRATWAAVKQTTAILCLLQSSVQERTRELCFTSNHYSLFSR